ncbi:hypothetical protein S40293_11581 [Stachybotrys chartarum IBT 40293]|nr:hypothetical protein S40293_11581 [Stachybotrys chartarum IBT 40293]
MQMAHSRLDASGIYEGLQSARLALAADHQSKQMRRKRRLSESELQSLDTQLQHLLGQDESQQYLDPDAERQGYLDGQLSRILPRKKRRPGYTEITRRIISENLTTSASDESKPKDEKKNSAVNFLFALPNHYMLVVERYGRVATTQGKLEQAVALFSTPVSILYRFNMPQESDWIEWFIKQPSGYYIAACLEARESVGSLSPEKRAYLTTQLEDVQRLHDWRSRLEVLNNETQNCMAFQADWLQFLKSTKQKQQPRPVHLLNGIEVFVCKAGQAYVDYYEPESSSRSTRTRLGPRNAALAPLHFSDQRFVYFTEHGIDIRDAEGVTLFSDLAGEYLATFPISKFPDNVRRLWYLVRNPLVVEQSRSGPSDVMPVKRGRGLPQSLQQTRLQTQSLRQDDALWLLQAYIDKEFPNGGYYRSWAKDDEPDVGAWNEAFLQ